MPVEIITKEDLSQAMASLRKELLQGMKLLIEDKMADEWIQGNAAMSLLGCKNTTLCRLCAEGLIKKRGIGKGSRYSKKSIFSYLESMGK